MAFKYKKKAVSEDAAETPEPETKYEDLSCEPLSLSELSAKVQGIISREILKIERDGIGGNPDVTKLKTCNAILTDCFKRQIFAANPSWTKDQSPEELERFLSGEQEESSDE